MIDGALHVVYVGTEQNSHWYVLFHQPQVEFSVAKCLKWNMIDE
jgi:hypothetical protein